MASSSKGFAVAVVSCRKGVEWQPAGRFAVVAGGGGAQAADARGLYSDV